MTRDIRDRLELFGSTVDVRRIALNMDQINKYNPPPNPAKLSDSRSSDYVRTYGKNSWELDALDPGVLVQLVADEISNVRQERRWQDRVETEVAAREGLHTVADRWDDVMDFVSTDSGETQEEGDE